MSVHDLFEVLLQQHRLHLPIRPGDFGHAMVAYGCINASDDKIFAAKTGYRGHRLRAMFDSCIIYTLACE